MNVRYTNRCVFFALSSFFCTRTNTKFNLMKLSINKVKGTPLFNSIAANKNRMNLLKLNAFICKGGNNVVKYRL